VHDYASVWQRVQDALNNGLSDWRQRASSLGQLQQNKRRDKKYRFDDDEVFKGLLLALLSNSTNWAVVERAIPALSHQFDNFSLGSYARRTNAQIEGIYQWFKSNRTASVVLRRGLLRLREAAVRLEARSRSSSGLHNYLDNLLKERGGDPIELAVTLGGERFGLVHKLPGFGVALAAEFLKNVGYDVAKPDRHINRALGCFGWVSFRKWPDRNGTQAPIAKEDELIAVMQEVARCAQSVSQSACFVDNVIWVLCARSGLYANNEALMKIGGGKLT
jgi:endonuclease III